MCLCASDPIFTRAVPVNVQWRRLGSSATSVNVSDMASIQRANSMCRLFCHIAPQRGVYGARSRARVSVDAASLALGYCRWVTANNSLVIIDPHASPAECIGERVFFVEEIVERVETIGRAVACAGFFDGQVGGEQPIGANAARPAQLRSLYSGCVNS